MLTALYSRNGARPDRTRWFAWGLFSLSLLSLCTPANGAGHNPNESTSLTELSVPAVVAKVRPSVVTVLTRGIPQGGSQHGAPPGSGSGVILDAGGHILTNNHLVQGVTSVVVGLSTGRLTPGRVVARDFLLDLALVRITAPDLVPAEFSRRASFEIGETVIAIGNPLALKGGSTVTVGVISALDRSVLTPEGETLYDLLQTDAAINPGNSGGPLVDRYGQVVGINVAIAPSAQAISYAIAMEAVTPHLQSMMDRGSVLRPDLGLIPLTITPSVAASFDLESDRGILALSVDPAKPAGRAGLQSGDVVTAIDNHPLYNIGDFWHAVSRASDQLSFQITTQGKAGTGTITVSRPGPARP
ncbi:MAG: trypsin-like peptidase domain-containing protein [Nitrospira sp.]|jgi:S1-C subfamily serine protease|nr:trypsin-like peptidase domain-containing protein [Nitrospira sp.]MBK8376364.1 trypsin-like peptidase domain-containing protein [Nitrospira sp.]MBK9998708.1 trypsin-like peptidase domain-containing protein [Nitrospira sp.]MBP6199280.1 trypsin-like peptidase domain-containing protein [Nitrospira sp.]MBP6206404.1 trypsin-like peptidase domain-containing protein [Nitrospira sp.]